MVLTEGAVSHADCRKLHQICCLSTECLFHSYNHIINASPGAPQSALRDHLIQATWTADATIVEFPHMPVVLTSVFNGLRFKGVTSVSESKCLTFDYNCHILGVKPETDSEVSYLGEKRTGLWIIQWWQSTLFRLSFIWKWRPQSLEEEWRGTESEISEVQRKPLQSLMIWDAMSSTGVLLTGFTEMRISLYSRTPQRIHGVVEGNELKVNISATWASAEPQTDRHHTDALICDKRAPTGVECINKFAFWEVSILQIIYWLFLGNILMIWANGQSISFYVEYMNIEYVSFPFWIKLWKFSTYFQKAFHVWGNGIPPDLLLCASITRPVHCSNAA